MRTRNSFNLCY